MVPVLQAVILCTAAVYFCVVLRDTARSREEVRREKGSIAFYSAVSAAVMFFGTFGVSDTALSVFIYRFTKKVEDRVIPGTIIAGAILPVSAMAVAFLSSFTVSTVTLAACIAAQSAGAVLGVKLILKLNEHMIRRVMAASLTGAALLIVMKLFFFGLSGGEGTGLGSWRLAAAAVAFFVFGGLNMAGMGATVPNMAVLLLLGMNLKAVFPVVMAGNIISCCFGGFKFVLAGEYTRKAALGSVFGVLGVLAAVHFVKNLNVLFLQAVMTVLLLYCACSMLREEFRASKPARCGSAEQKQIERKESGK